MKEEILSRFSAENILSVYKDKPVIKVLLGIRRSGKSYILKLIRQKLLERRISKNRIVYIDFEDFENYRFLSSKALYEYIKGRSRAAGHKRLHLLFDEIQEVADWEKCINGLYSSESIDCDIYITGSNANLLSSELATYLSGRYVKIKIFPLSYSEFLQFLKKEDGTDSFMEFMKYGGFPGLRNMYGDEESMRSYIDGIYSSVILKDVIRRNEIRNTGLLERIVLYLADNIGNIFSAKRIADFMKSGGRSLGVETVYNDLDFLQQALFAYKVRRWDIKGKRLLETMEKYYIADQGLRFCLLGFKDTAVNGLLENIVYLELLRRDYAVYIGKLGEYEIDFVAEKSGERLYIQTAYMLSSEEALRREYRPLQLIADNYPKLILTMDDLPDSNTNGILRKNLRKWLMEKS